ncbi:MAG: methylated-DNA--[protein]-cysteine S-methyltransferase [Oscillospiraceae bacterium]|jgi:methylated-DNA-[protein]-cysteine S-methyltransferase|nr:methylated-DNA--[protein]-cysteine S-methyltransferase [Oscillospiraceae bacterium]
MTNAFFYDTPLGRLGIAEADGTITHVFYKNSAQPTAYALGETPLLREAAAQLNDYFDGKRKAFDLPLRPEGTAFACAVWAELMHIPYGETRTYGQLAAAIGQPKAARAVGRALHVNPISIIIPCHRVIGADGQLTGYAGGLDVKRFLLALEASYRA